MLCRDIICVIEHTYPRQVALEWDNVGLLVGRTEKEVERIYVALDATDDVIDDAIAKGADMLITHHPLIFSPLKTITDEHFIENRVVKLLQHDISYYALHTNYDVIRMAQLSVDRLGLKNTVVLELTDVDQGMGVGRVGELSEAITLENCCRLVKEKFGLQAVKVFGNLNAKVKRIAVSPGSGKHMSHLAIEKGVDVFITGDIDHHEGIDAVARGTAIIDAGHYGLEYVFIEDMASYFMEKLDAVAIEKAEIIQPFQVI